MLCSRHVVGREDEGGGAGRRGEDLSIPGEVCAGGGVVGECVGEGG